jgi:hypothetical protein
VEEKKQEPLKEKTLRRKNIPSGSLGNTRFNAKNTFRAAFMDILIKADILYGV